MSDDDKLPDLGDLDWDSALDEWEKNTFVPEIARDAEKAEAESAARAEAALGTLGKTTENPAAEPLPPASGRGSLRNASGEGTVIAPVPRELRNEPRRSSTIPPIAPLPPPPRTASPSAAPPPSRAARGGLGQLFSKGGSVPPPRGGSRPPGPTPPPRPVRPSTSSYPPEGAPREPQDEALASTGESELAALGRPGALSGFPPEGQTGKTRQLARPSNFLDDTYRDDGSPDGEDEATRVGPGLHDAVRDEERRRHEPGGLSYSDAVTVAARDGEVEALGTGDRSIFDVGEPEPPPRAEMGSLSDADTATRHPGDVAPVEQAREARDALRPSGAEADDAPTFSRASPSAVPLTGGAEGALPDARFREPVATQDPPAVAPPPAEDVPSRWLDGPTTTAYRQRAGWLEEEARAIIDDTERARALLGVSELLALVGDAMDAVALATEARDLAPDLALAWRQARQLMNPDAGYEARVEALDAEAAASPTPAARAHAMLVAADELRIHGDGDAAVQRWLSASRLDPADMRAPAARAALALSQDQHTGAGTDLAENSELIALDRAMAIALKLRGAPRPSTDPDLVSVNDALRRARQALAASDVVTAAQALAEVASEPALAKGALWLSAALGATHIAGRRASAKALRSLANDGEPLARRQLAARGIELGDPELVTAALAGDDEAFTAQDRSVLLALAGQDAAEALPLLDARDDLAPLLDALASLEAPADEAAAQGRARRVAGREEHAALAALGRLLAARTSVASIDAALAAVRAPRGASAAGVALEVAVTTARWDEVSEALGTLAVDDEPGASSRRHVAAALVAERAGNAVAARRAWREALTEGVTHDSVLRAVASLDNGVDLPAELLRIADELPEGPASAVLRLEALARRMSPSPATPDGESTPAATDDEQLALLERIHRGAPTLGIAAFLAERVARRRGDVDEVLRWLQERKAFTNDALEMALDAVREALLVADRDPELASARLEEAHRARPEDVALRELHERLATEPLTDRAAWREAQAARVTGAPRAMLLTEAALEHEILGDAPAALRAAQQAREAGDQGLSRPIEARAVLETGATETLTSELMTLARETGSVDVRRRTYERLAELDEVGRKDAAAALMWHRTILEESPEHLPSLRYVEHALVGQGRDADLEPVFEAIARTLAGVAPGEVAGHAQLATRLRTRAPGGWEGTGAMAKLAATQKEPSLWGLRALNAHARAAKDEQGILDTTLALLERTQRPPERSALLLRASEAAARREQVADARAYLEQAAAEDPGDVVTWGFLAEVRERAGETRGAADACESLARTSAVPDHQLLAWYDAARIWLDEVDEVERGMSALEHCAEIDVTHADVFERLSSLYTERRLDAELARLLEKRLEAETDEGERVAYQVELARALADMGDIARARASLEGALAHRPDHTTALAAMAALCSREGDWAGAEQAYVRLARLLVVPAEQREVYEKLGEIYGTHTGNLSRAEVAYREVLKRAPADLPTLEKLVDLYKRQGDLERAVETQTQLVAASNDPAARLQRLIELAAIHEATARDVRRSEQVLESARREFPTSVVALRAMAEFYARQRQMPAMQILLDRAASDARRSFAAGRFVTSLFEVLHAAYELRGRKDAARVVAATLAAVEGQPASLIGGEARAIDPRLDDLLAPELIGPALRALFHRAGDSLDAASPLDLRALRAQPLVPGTPLGTVIGAVATVVGLGALQIIVSPALGRVALPLGSNPPALLVGEGLMHVPNEAARTFVVVRALKMILARGSSLLRGDKADVPVLLSALFTAFNPSFSPPGVDGRRVAELSRKLLPLLPRNLDPTTSVIALEAAGTLGNDTPQIGHAGHAWANRVALLAVGDPNAALDAIAWSRGEEAAPRGAEERAGWIARTPEARELMTFSVSEAYAEARIRLGLER
ncbi:MAG: Exonuclease SbcC [Labilithrix sp.]|nr:Exonuclease SbcC [Labilithrix sp.]